MPFSLEELQAVAEVTSTTIRTPIDGLRAAATRVVQRHQELTPQDIAGTAAPEALHRRPYRRKKPAPVRPSRLDPFVAEIRVWLSLNPDLTGLAIHERLAVQHGPLVSSRTVQRLVRQVRTELLRSEVSAVSQNLGEAA